MWRLVLVLAGCGRVFGLVELHDDAPAGDLVAHYSFEDSLSDATGNGHDGTCLPTQCPQFVDGPRGRAGSFDGLDDFIAVAGSDDLASNAGTAAAWFFMRATTASVSCPVNKLLGTLGNNTWQLCIEPNLRIDFFTSAELVHTVVPLPLDSWHHVAIRWDGGDKTISLDGIGVAQGGMIDMSFRPDALVIGSDIDDGKVVASFGGLIDEVRIYNRALTAEEITTLYEQ